MFAPTVVENEFGCAKRIVSSGVKITSATFNIVQGKKKPLGMQCCTAILTDVEGLLLPEIFLFRLESVVTGHFFYKIRFSEVWVWAGNASCLLR